MITTEQLILNELAAIRQRLDSLLVPVAKQAGKQVATMTAAERRAENKRQTEIAKKRRA